MYTQWYRQQHYTAPLATIPDSDWCTLGPAPFVEEDAALSKGPACCCSVCKSVLSCSFWVVMAGGSFDTVTIFGPGDLATCGDPLKALPVVPLPIGLAAPNDFNKGDIVFGCEVHWFCSCDP